MLPDRQSAAPRESANATHRRLLVTALMLAPLLLIGGVLHFLTPPKIPLASSAPQRRASASLSPDTAVAEACDCASVGTPDTDHLSNDGSAPATDYAAGPLVVVPAVAIHLAGGHSLKVSLALQPAAKGTGELPSAAARRALVSVYGGKTMDELSTQAGRLTAKKTALRAIRAAYGSRLLGIYYTSFVLT